MNAAIFFVIEAQAKDKPAVLYTIRALTIHKAHETAQNVYKGDYGLEHTFVNTNTRQAYVTLTQADEFCDKVKQLNPNHKE